MIPTIEQIVLGLIDGSYSKESAIAWLNDHVTLASESEGHDFVRAIDRMADKLAIAILCNSGNVPDQPWLRKQISIMNEAVEGLRKPPTDPGSE